MLGALGAMNSVTPASPQPEPAPKVPAATPSPAPAAVLSRDGDPVGAESRLLEARLLRLENYLGFKPLTSSEATFILSAEVPAPAAPAPIPAAAAEEGLEMEIGEYWLARIGIVALMVGLGFLVAYPFALPAWVPSLIGFSACGLLVYVSRRWHSALPELAQLLHWGALFLGYFATLRLHFFVPAPLLTSRALALGLLVVVLAWEYVVAVRRGRQGTVALVTSLGFVTAIVGDSLVVALSLASAMAGLAVWLVRRHRWHGHYALTLCLAFLLHLLYLLGNPLAGHPMHGVAAAPLNLLFLALYIGIFATANFLPGAKEHELVWRIGRPLVIAGGVLLLGGLNIVMFHQVGFPWVELALSAGFLVLAMAGWWHHASRYATAFYACAGYVTLSVFLVRQFPGPAAYGWLAWEGLLVAATAVWFRSKIIVVANVFIFAGMYAVYLLFAPASGPVNLSFAVVALLTARLLNWQSERLELRTELMRNFYLGAATVAVPYGLYHTVPPGWVSTSWLLAAAAYFGVSIWLRNRKYRWMAIGTVLATVVYVFVFDLARLPPAYRIVSFLVLGVGLLVISLFYSRRRRQVGGK